MMIWKEGKCNLASAFTYVANEEKRRPEYKQF